MFRWQIDTCINSLGSCIGMEAMEECHRFISLRRERRHKNTLERQTKKSDCGRETQVAAQTTNMAEKGTGKKI